MNKIRHIIGLMAPSFIKRMYFNYLSKKKSVEEWKKQWAEYDTEATRLKGTDKPIKVLFLVLYSSVWKYESVYKLMQKDSRFRPQILVCPVADYGKEHMLEHFKPTYEMFKKRGFDVICAYDEKTKQYINISDIKPDILFYSFQWQNHVDKRYNINSLHKYLKCYVNYSYKNVPFEWSIASRPQQMMWMYFSECEENRKLAMSFHPREFKKNIHVVGYPMYDELKDLKETGYQWKINDKTHKKIIWAPHHTIPGDDSIIKFSTFLIFAKDMLDFAAEYKNSIEIAFKPHPQLRPALYKHKDWGKEKTDNYYNIWKEGDNTTLITAEYADLFKSSDAMIHDCGSFIIEYLYVNKPVMFLTNYNRKKQCNEVGKKALDCHYQGTTRNDIETFIKHVVLEGYDSMKEKRTSFYNKTLIPPNNKTAAENIISEISKALQI